jgi:hypothetical protein
MGLEPREAEAASSRQVVVLRPQRRRLPAASATAIPSSVDGTCQCANHGVVTPESLRGCNEMGASGSDLVAAS